MLFSSRERVRLAKSTDDINELKRLAKDEMSNVREAVAKRKDVPLEILSELANDEDECVRMAVACNDSAVSMEILEYLSQDSSRHVRDLAKQVIKYKEHKI